MKIQIIKKRKRQRKNEKSNNRSERTENVKKRKGTAREEIFKESTIKKINNKHMAVTEGMIK